MTDMAERLATLEDRESIKELLALYAFHVAYEDARAATELFTEDGVFTSAAGTAIRSELEAYLEGRLALGHRVPLVQNHVIEIDGDDAVVRSFMFAPWGPDGAICGAYRDVVRRTAQGWRFVERNFTPFAKPR